MHLIGSIDLESGKVLLYIFLFFHASYFSLRSHISCLYQALFYFLYPWSEISIGRMGIVDPSDEEFLILLWVHTPRPTDDADITLRDSIAGDLE